MKCRHEPNAETLEFIEHDDQVLERSSESVEAPTNHRVDSTPTRIREQAIKSWPSVFRAGDAFIDVLGGGPTPRCNVSPKLGQLILGLLVERADARVNGGSHCVPPFRKA